MWAPHLLHGQRARHTANVGEPVLPVIPATIRKVNPAHECHRLVDDNDLFMMCPQVDGGGDVVWMTHHLKAERSSLR